jgi:OPT family oligopeptide transporter
MKGGFREVVQWTLWGGTACMVSSGLLNFLFQWRTSMRAFRNLGRMFKRGGHGNDPLESVEAPMPWFLIGQVVSLIALAYLAKRTFDMPYWLAALALVLSFVLALVACRVTGETDTTPVGSMGQLTQMIVGGIHPGSATTTLMSANVVSSAAISSADLLTDLKSGYLLGANPRKQFIAQFSGIFIGTLITVLAFSVIVPNATVLGSDQFPAPAAQSWRAVALTMSKGLAVLHPLKKYCIEVGAAVGVVLAILPLVFPKHQKYLPSAAGVGLAWTFHWYYGLLFFLGAFLAWAWQKRSPKSAEEFTYPVASGVIAGGSLMGVLLIFVENGPEMIKKFFGG